MKQPKNDTQMMMKILGIPKETRLRVDAAQRLAADLFKLVALENAEAIMQLAEHMDYDPDQLNDDIIDFYDLVGQPALK